MQELLASYYGMQRGVDRSSDVESTNFDAKSYVRGLLQKDKVETLLRKDDEMVSMILLEGLFKTLLARNLAFESVKDWHTISEGCSPCHSIGS